MPRITQCGASFRPFAMSPNRWRIPIGAVAVHICIGSVYAWSTFTRPIQALFPDEPWWFKPALYDIHDRADAGDDRGCG